MHRPSSRLQFTEEERAARRSCKGASANPTRRRISWTRQRAAIVPQSRLLPDPSLVMPIDPHGPPLRLMQEVACTAAHAQGAGGGAGKCRRGGRAHDASAAWKAVGYGNRERPNWRRTITLKPGGTRHKAEQAAVLRPTRECYFTKRRCVIILQLAACNPISRILAEKKRMQKQYAAAYRGGEHGTAEGRQRAAQTREKVRRSKKGPAEVHCPTNT